MKPDKKVLLSLKDVPDSTWQKLAEKKIYFGHQSVGFNLIDGIRDVMRENPQIRLKLVETDAPTLFVGPLFAHSRLGENEIPLSKIEAFSRLMDRGLGNKAEIAFFKFCFVDITGNTDVDKIFADYKSALSALKQKYPNTIFVAITVPLTTNPPGIKPWVKGVIKRVIGRPSGDDGNIERERFNKKIRSEFPSPMSYGLSAINSSLFDLALFESTFPDGSRNVFEKDGENYYSLVPGYTEDGGHLNEKGRKFIAEQLLIFLTQFIR